MFTKSRTDQAKGKAQDAASSVQDAAASAGHVLREKVAPVVAAKAHDAKDWAAPHVERGIKEAAPRVEAAVDRVSPAVDAARDKIVDDILPRLVDAVNAAAAAAASSGVAEHAEEARGRAKGAAAVLKGDAVAKRKGGKLKKFALVTGLLAAIGAAVAAFKKQQGPHVDPWAVPAGTYPSSSSSYGSSSSSTTAGSSAPSGSASGTSTSSALDSGAAGDALDNGGTAEVPGMTEESTAAAEAIAESAGNDSPKKQGDPLTDPIEDVEGSSKKKP